MRPSNDVLLEPLVEESDVIKAAVHAAPEGKYATGVTAEEWFRRRVSGRRAKNYAGPEAWKASRGTEDQSVYA
ncbi:hypothetical protein EWM64_g2570 [Hericium alpestre]|uniref:Uncharacterized protein n=1 Tax=Hericium alpestre TaxID=135208 RepID=A0A4Z0A6B1_9AGAM|nr:hypothetical protein EWM64_g2570 [Hericium alpestre]